MAVFALSIFTGACLLFQVQPLIGKYILPWFGGSPGVWTACMLFFQVLLAGGYAYAHLTSRWFKPRTQAIIHLVLLLSALALLPITPSDSWKPSGPGHPLPRILALLALSLGLPYFVLSSTGPLMQQWFSLINPGRSPYRLYALSNAGSLLALVSYPVLVEPHVTRSGQATLWGWGLGFFAVFSGFCAIKLLKAHAHTRSPSGTSGSFGVHPLGGLAGSDSLKGGHPTPRRILWVALPACASVLLLAVTNKMCQDVAVIPFLWVLPLALYLLSFIICFDSPRWYVRLLFGVALVIMLAAMCWAISKGPATPLYLILAIYSVGLFVCCMVCHGELYRLKPAPSRLTSFYLMIAAGGALGGIFVAVCAPLIFNDYYELQCGLFLCGLLALVTWLKERPEEAESKIRDAVPVLRSSPATEDGERVPTMHGELAGTKSEGRALPLAATLSEGATLPPKARTSAFGWLKRRGVAIGVSVVALLALGVALWFQASKVLEGVICKSRDFYGVLTVYEYGKDGGNSHYFQLLHGRTLHGMQLADPLRSCRPTTYYSEDSGVGLALRSFPAGHRRIGLVGLGVGTLASYARAGDYVRIYEINPEVLRLASTNFTYLSDCLGRLEVVLGDARLSLEREPAQNFDVIALDAFSGDAIPVHLLTREAFAVYERHLKTNGVIAIHISNTSLGLAPVVFRLARQFNYDAALIDYGLIKCLTLASTWVVLSHNAEFINSRVIREAARPTEASWENGPLWTDDFTSLFQILGPHPRYIETKLDPAEERCQKGWRMRETGYFAAAIAQYRLALERDPNHPDAMNNLAWLLATAPEASLRKGPEAIQLAQESCLLTRHRAAATYGTLAAAYAEAGRFEDAITNAEKACALARKSGEKELLEKDQELLELYRQGKPYHERGK